MNPTCPPCESTFGLLIVLVTTLFTVAPSSQAETPFAFGNDVVAIPATGWQTDAT